MSRKNRPRVSRRRLLQGAGVVAAGTAAPAIILNRGDAQDQTADPKFLIVLTGSGGASIIDSLLAIRFSETQNRSTLNCFADGEVSDIADSPFRAVDLERRRIGAIPIPMVARQSDFVRDNKEDIMVATWTRTSVNHSIGQRRAVTGNEAWNGRTLQELVALRNGGDYAIPNVHLSTGSGYTSRGNDPGVPSWAFGETVADPGLWPLSLDGARGLGRAIQPSLLQKARALRNDQLDPMSRFGRVFGEAPRLKHWRSIRGGPQAALEEQALIDKLIFFPDSERYPLSEYGLQESPSAAAVREAFPRLEQDPMEAQAALAFLLIKFGVSSTVTLGPNFDVGLKEGVDISSVYGGGGVAGSFQPGDMFNTPIGFDFSHQGHRATQALMWDRVFRAASGLIRLLKNEEYADGESFWDRSMIYVASDFGRTKTRPSGANEWGTGHDLNNGVVIISPMAQGNTVLGGVDRDTGLTYGFDPATGEPDLGRTMDEPQIFAGILQALGVDTSEAGLPDMPAMRRS